MAATQILASGTTAARSSVVSLADGASSNLVVFVASGNIPADAIYDVFIQTSAGNPTLFKRMTGGDFTAHISGPGDVYADRVYAGAAGTPSGIDKN
jgi:hypothetical protein